MNSECHTILDMQKSLIELTKILPYYDKTLHLQTPFQNLVTNVSYGSFLHSVELRIPALSVIFLIAQRPTFLAHYIWI